MHNKLTKFIYCAIVVIDFLIINVLAFKQIIVKNKLQLKALYQKLISKEISNEELEELVTYFDAENDDELHQMVRAELDLTEEAIQPSPSSEEILMGTAIYHQIEQEIFASNKKVKVIKLWRSIAAAAILLVVLGVYLYQLPNNTDQSTITVYGVDILPGSNKAMLTLANGKHIVLADALNGNLANENDVIINKTRDGQLVYKSAIVNKNVIGYNLLETPKGGQYAIVLSDGTKVVLNAASSLKYPASFNGTNRTVELKGEAYFEVAKDKLHPFIVNTASSLGNGKGQQVKVLGTHFNISSYDNEPYIKTTLLEGSVIINNKSKLKPGEQAVGEGNNLEITKADTELAVAWKDNKFMFRNAKIQDIMRMAERWYDVEVVYVGNVPTDLLGGSVSRFNNISKLLNILELAGNFHFKIEGRRITVTK